MAITIGNSKPNVINGTTKSDILVGLAGDDVLYGGLGNDLIDGGLGVDTAVFNGRLQDYQITQFSKLGLLTGVSGADGCDLLTNVEVLRFDNGSYDVRTGATTLTMVSVTGGGTVTEGDGHGLAYTFTRAGDLSASLDVKYAFDGTADASDYQDSNGGVLHFAAGSATATLVVAVVDDTKVEATETLRVRLLADSHYEFGASTSATGTIQDNDTTVTHVSYYMDPQAVTEGGALAFHLHRDVADAALDLVFHYNPAFPAGAATPGADFTGPAEGATIHFAAGQSDATLSFATINDGVYEGQEAFAVRVEATTPNVIVAPDNAGYAAAGGTDPTQINIGHIADAQTQLTLSVSSVTVGEADGFAHFTVTLSGPSAQPVSVDFHTLAGSATAGADYADTGGTLVWNPGDALTKDVAVAIVNDALTEQSEQFALALSGASGASIANAQGTATIQDDDPRPVVTVSSNVTSVTEGGDFTLTFHRTGNLANTLDAGFKYGPTPGATPGTDFVDPSHQVHFDAGQADATVVIHTIDDLTPEYTESFNVSVSTPPSTATGPAYSIGQPGNVGLAILDNDPVPQVSVTAPMYVTEGQDVGVTFHRVGGLQSALDVTFAFGGPPSGGATLGVDYADPGTRTVHFDAGQADSVLTIHTIDDTTLEFTENFNVSVMMPTQTQGSPPAYISASPGSAGINIQDNDVAPTVSLSVDHNTTVEGGAFALTFHRSSAVGDLDVAYQYNLPPNGATTPGADFVDQTPHSVHFAAGQSDAVLTIQTIDDTVAEGPAEFFNVGITFPTPPQGQPAPYLPSSTANNVGLTIQDNDTAQPPSLPTVNVTAADGSAQVTVHEGDTMTFNFMRNGDLSQGLDVGYTLSTGQVNAATLGQDYFLPDGTPTHTSASGSPAAYVHFDAGSDHASVTFTTVQDGIVESNGGQGESFSLGLEPMNTTYLNGSHFAVSGTILDV